MLILAIKMDLHLFACFCILLLATKTDLHFVCIFLHPDLGGSIFQLHLFCFFPAFTSTYVFQKEAQPDHTILGRKGCDVYVEAPAAGIARFRLRGGLRQGAGLWSGTERLWLAWRSLSRERASTPSPTVRHDRKPCEAGLPLSMRLEHFPLYFCISSESCASHWWHQGGCRDASRLDRTLQSLSCTVCHVFSSSSSLRQKPCKPCPEPSFAIFCNLSCKLLPEVTSGHFARGGKWRRSLIRSATVGPTLAMAGDWTFSPSSSPHCVLAKNLT